MGTPSNMSNTKTVATLSELGQTYVYRGAEVVPSQHYSEFSGRDVKDVNRALKRIAQTGRLVVGEDFFSLSYDEAKGFFKVPVCHLLSNHGITLLTRKAVNTLSHYFDDANSIGLSDTVNTVATGFLKMEEDAKDDPIMALLMVNANIRREQLKQERALKEHDAQFETLRLVNDDDTLTAGQIAEVDRLIQLKTREFGSFVVAGLVKRRIKSQFFKIASTRTYKEIPRRFYGDVTQLIGNWQPTESEVVRHNL